MGHWLLFLLVSAHICASSVDDCIQYLLKNEGLISTYENKELKHPSQYYIDKSTARQKGKEATTFRDVRKDKKIIERNGKDQAPLIFRNLLPEGVGLINHELYKTNEPGVVKFAAGGEFVSLRSDIFVNGEDLSTNVGVLRQALIDNSRKEVKTLVPDNAAAVFIFLHGGGTTTTGHHVAISLANHLQTRNIATISLDLPLHGEGPRKIFTHPQEFVEWIQTFIAKYVSPSQKPVFLGGHSMGGELTALYMKHSNKNDPYVKGLLALSSPVDPAPNVITPAEKHLQVKKMWEAIHSEGQMDKDLLDGILTQGKNSPIGYFFEEILSSHLDMSVPADEGSSLLPTLWVWGQHDYLLAGGYDHVISENLTKLKNSTVKVYGERNDFAGNRVQIGHLIFDHYREGTKDFEAWSDMIEFIYKTIDQPIQKANVKAGKDKETFIMNPLREYINVLAFREFVADYKFGRKKAKDGDLLRAMNKEISMLEAMMKKGQVDEEEALLKVKEMRAKRSGEFVPDGPEGDKGRELLRDLKDQENNYRYVDAETKKLRPMLEMMNGQLREKRKEFVGKFQLMLDTHQVTDEHPLISALNDYEFAYRALHKQNEHINELIDEQLSVAFSKGEPSKNDLEPSEMMLDELAHYEDTVYAEFKKAETRLEESFSEQAKQGELGPELQNLATQIQTLDEQVKKLERLNQIYDHEQREILQVMAQLQKELIVKYNNELYEYEEVPLQEIFDQPFSEWHNHSKVLQQAWSEWRRYWKERPQTGAISLY